MLTAAQSLATRVGDLDLKVIFQANMIPIQRMIHFVWRLTDGRSVPVMPTSRRPPLHLLLKYGGDSTVGVEQVYDAVGSNFPLKNCRICTYRQRSKRVFYRTLLALCPLMFLRAISSNTMPLIMSIQMLSTDIGFGSR